jgi:hypothetical protein
MDSAPLSRSEPVHVHVLVLVLVLGLSGCRPGPTCCEVVELRQYVLRPGQRDVLISLFDRELLAPQEAGGMRIPGQFRDLDRPDRFVWLRGYPDMASRERSLTAFYQGPTWKAHRDAARATMIDADDVLLLRPARPGSGFAAAGDLRSPVIVLATIYHLAAPATGEVVADFERAAAAAGAAVFACFVTDPSPNTYPALPVREGEQVFVAFTAAAPGVDLSAALARWTAAPTETRRLGPSAGSRLGRRIASRGARCSDRD